MMKIKETYTVSEVLELLGAISAAASGWAKEGLSQEHEWFTVAFQDTLELRRKYDALLETTPRWIPVSERLPRTGNEVLIVDFGRHRNVCYLEFVSPAIGLKWVGDGVEIGLQNVTHWMPLPALPKEVEG